MQRNPFFCTEIVHVASPWRRGKGLALAGLTAAALSFVAGEAPARAQSCDPTVTLPGFVPVQGPPTAFPDGRMSLTESNGFGSAEVGTFTNPQALPGLPGTVTASAGVLIDLAKVGAPFGSGDAVQLTLRVTDLSAVVMCTDTETIATNTFSVPSGHTQPLGCHFTQAHGAQGIYLATVELDANGGGLFNTADAAVQVMSPITLRLVALAPHDECTSGSALDPSCGSCIANVCAVDPFCCTINGGNWDTLCVGEVQSVCHSLECRGACPHAPCSTGAALPSTCNPAVQTICNQDAFCCNAAEGGSWDSICVGEVASISGDNCN